MDEADDCSELEDSAEEEVSELELAVSDEEDSEDELASPAGRLDELSLACPAVASSEGWDDDSDEEMFCSDETEEIDEDDNETDESDEADDISDSEDELSLELELELELPEDSTTDDDELELAELEPPATCDVAWAWIPPNTVLNCSSVTHTEPTQSFSVFTSLTARVPFSSRLQLAEPMILRTFIMSLPSISRR